MRRAVLFSNPKFNSLYPSPLTFYSPPQEYLPLKQEDIVQFYRFTLSSRRSVLFFKLNFDSFFPSPLTFYFPPQESLCLKQETIVQL